MTSGIPGDFDLPKDRSEQLIKIEKPTPPNALLSAAQTYTQLHNDWSILNHNAEQAEEAARVKRDEADRARMDAERACRNLVRLARQVDDDAR